MISCAALSAAGQDFKFPTFAHELAPVIKAICKPSPPQKPAFLKTRLARVGCQSGSSRSQFFAPCFFVRPAHGRPLFSDLKFPATRISKFLRPMIIPARRFAPSAIRRFMKNGGHRPTPTLPSHRCFINLTKKSTTWHKAPLAPFAFAVMRAWGHPWVNRAKCRFGSVRRLRAKV